MNTTQAPSQLDQPTYQITDADRNRVERIALAWKAHDGELDKPFERMEDEPDMNVMGNEVQPAVDAIVNFVFGDEVEISVEQNAPSGAQELLDTVWGRKEKRIPLLQRWLMNGDMSGRAFLRIVPGPKKTFELVEIDPSTIYVQTAPQNCQKEMLFCIEYCCDEKNTLGNPVKMFYREEIARVDPDKNTTQGVLDTDSTWSIQHWTQETTSGTQPTVGSWIPAGEPIPWPYPFPPIFSNQNLPKPNNFWGYPGVSKSLIGINEAINLVNSNINITEKIQRILYSNGVGEGTIDVHPNKITQLPELESKITAVNLQTNTANSREFVGDLRGEVEELTGIPMIASGRTAYMPNGPQSGIAIKLLFMSLLKKMNKMRCLYGDTMIEVSQALLVLAGFSEKIDITLGWQSPLPADVLADVQAAQAKNALGVSKQTLLGELGYDYKEEMKKIKQEQADALANNPLVQQPVIPGQPPATMPEQTPQQSSNNPANQQNDNKQAIGQKG